jgi:hypothetical protein
LSLVNLQTGQTRRLEMGMLSSFLIDEIWQTNRTLSLTNWTPDETGYFTQTPVLSSLKENERDPHFRTYLWTMRPEWMGADMTGRK